MDLGRVCAVDQTKSRSYSDTSAMRTASRPNDDLHTLIKRYERLHQALKRDVLELVPAHLRHHGLRQSSEVSLIRVLALQRWRIANASSISKRSKRSKKSASPRLFPEDDERLIVHVTALDQPARHRRAR